MKRTQIYLDEDLDRELRAAAAAEGRSAADLIREALRALLRARRGDRAADPMLEIAGTVRGGPGDGATEHDRYLYGRRRRRE